MSLFIKNSEISIFRMTNKPLTYLTEARLVVNRVNIYACAALDSKVCKISLSELPMSRNK